MQIRFSGLEFLSSFVIFTILFVTKTFTAIFSALAWPTELKLADSIGICRTTNISLDIYVEADMTTTQGKEGPLNKMGHNCGEVPPLDARTCSYYSYRIERTLPFEMCNCLLDGEVRRL